MRRVAKGIRPGVIVKKGDEIGYVGMTGSPRDRTSITSCKSTACKLTRLRLISLIQKIFPRISSRSYEPRHSRSLSGSNALRSTRDVPPQALLAKQAQKSAAERDEEADQAANAAGRVRLRPVKSVI